MKIVCIENTPSTAIGWGVFLWDNTDTLFTTQQANLCNPLVVRNLQRLQRKINPLPKVLLDWITKQEDVHFQIASNEWNNNIPWLLQNSERHKILAKSWLIEILWQYPSLRRYLPRSQVISLDVNPWEYVLNQLKWFVSENKMVVLKCSALDWNGRGVWFINTDSTHLCNDIDLILSKFWDILSTDGLSLKDSEYVIQEFLESGKWEWSVTFSIQTSWIELWWLAHNVVVNGEYFASSSITPFMSDEEKLKLKESLLSDFLPLLESLRIQWIRGNIGFDLLFCQVWDKDNVPFVLESNWIHRTTWSTLPNNFARNTGNNSFFWFPIHARFLSNDYSTLNSSSMLKLSKQMELQWIISWQPQIMALKYEGTEWWYPVIWIGLAGHSKLDDIFYFVKNTHILNSDWEQYLQKVLLNLHN